MIPLTHNHQLPQFRNVVVGRDGDHPDRTSDFELLVPLVAPVNMGTLAQTTVSQPQATSHQPPQLTIQHITTKTIWTRIAAAIDTKIRSMSLIMSNVIDCVSWSWPIQLIFSVYICNRSLFLEFTYNILFVCLLFFFFFFDYYYLQFNSRGVWPTV